MLKYYQNWIFDGLDWRVTFEISLNPSMVLLNRPSLEFFNMLFEALRIVGDSTPFDCFLSRSIGTGFMRTLEVPG